LSQEIRLSAKVEKQYENCLIKCLEFIVSIESDLDSRSPYIFKSILFSS